MTILFVKRFLLALTLIGLVTWLFTLFTYRSAPDEFSHQDLVLLGAAGLAVCILQAIICSVLFRSPRVFSTLVGLFGVTNLISGHLALSSEFLTHPPIVKLAIVGMLITVFVVATLAATRHIIVAVVMIGVLAAGGLYVGFRAFDFEPDPGAAGTLLPHASSDLRQFVKTRFKQRPNVYLLSFDSIVPRVLFKKHFGEEEARYHDVLDEHFRKIPNFFSDGMSTRPSLNLLLALDVRYMKSLRPAKRETFYRGNTNSPLFLTFKANGYETTTAYSTHYFGRTKGPYIDNYLVFQKSAVCKFAPESTKPFSLFGICNESMKRNLLAVLGLPQSPDYLALDAMVRAVKRIGKKDAPQIILAYLYTPGHTPLSYTRSDEERRLFHQEYKEKSEIAANSIETMVAAIRENDSDGLIFIFGDHGPWLSRGLKLPMDPQFFVQDRYGVYGGVSPKDACPDVLGRTRVRKFNTPRLIAREIVACLSGDPDQYKQIIGDVEHFYVHLGHRYEAFLYE